MYRALVPLAGLLLAGLTGCHLIQGHCDCDNVPSIRTVGATATDLVPVPSSTPAPVVPRAEPLKEMPHLTPDK